MSTQQSVQRDERSVAVENASFRWAYIVLANGLFIDIMYRGLARSEAAWDLFALILVSGAVGTIFQARQKILGPGWVRKSLLIAAIAGVLGAIVAAILVITRAM